ncbi:MAG: hypothetical protein V7637_2493 [Mycobacteriales bacterium]|jgi:Tfp pilus assembly protein FimT
MTADRPVSTRWIVLVVDVVLLLLVVIGLAVYRSGSASSVALAKADQLAATLGAAGLPVPARDQIVRVLGEDGGAACADPGGALSRAVLNSHLSNGAGGPGSRPVIAAGRLVQGEKLVLSVYCPDQLAGFTRYVDGLKYSDVIKS